MTTDNDVNNSYSVTNNGTSQPLLFRVQQASVIPGKPEVPKAPGGRLNFHNDMYRDDYLEVEVRPFPGMANGQSITLEWVGPYHTWLHTERVDAVQTLRFQVPRLEVVDAIGSSVEISYSVNNTGSPPFTLNIDSQGMDMPPPRYFPQEDADTAAVSILSPDQQSSHKGRVRWVGVTEYDSEEVYLQPDRPKYFQIPRRLVDENRGREVLINYSIYRGNQEPFRFSRVRRLKL